MPLKCSASPCRERLIIELKYYWCWTLMIAWIGVGSAQSVVRLPDGSPIRPPRWAYGVSPTPSPEHGVAMKASVLRSKRAIEVNIAIVRTFIRLRQMLARKVGPARPGNRHSL